MTESALPAHPKSMQSLKLGVYTALLMKVLGTENRDDEFDLIGEGNEASVVLESGKEAEELFHPWLVGKQA